LNRIILLTAVTLAIVTAVFVTASPVDEFTLGNQYYEQKNYDSAVTVYQQLVRQGLESAPLYFNLGNACFRSGDLGHAMLYYLRAQRLDPNDPDITANVEFARKFTSVQMEGVQLNPVSSLFESIVMPYHLSALAWLSSAFFILLFAFLIARFGYGVRNALVKTGTWLSLLLLLSASLLTTVKYRHDYLIQRAVVIAEESVVHTGPSELSEKELDAAPGLVVEILTESGNFYNVLFENKRRGWILKDLVAVL
jgi:tetratricopeptide (TPR) repeat protein